MPVVPGIELFCKLFFPYVLQPLGRAEAIVCLAGLHQLLGVLTINIQPLRLYIRTTSSLPGRAFVVVDAGPVECRYEVLDRSFDFSRLIRIFYPKDERPVLSFGKQVVVKGCAEAADVKVPCRTGSESDSNWLFHRLNA
jgi:hypothetical protein